ncbi:MAG: DJ-1/PfpI family protein, partial [Treponema sp.]|nr:DJ-1/PfpI family protein [Treponema sp.]
MKSAIVLIADGSEELEALSPVDYLRRAGVDVSVVSVGTASRTVTL